MNVIETEQAKCVKNNLYHKELVVLRNVTTGIVGAILFSCKLDQVGGTRGIFSTTMEFLSRILNGVVKTNCKTSTTQCVKDLV